MRYIADISCKQHYRTGDISILIMQKNAYGLFILFFVLSGALLAGFRVFDFHLSDKPGRSFFPQAIAGGDMIERKPPEA